MENTFQEGEFAFPQLHSIDGNWCKEPIKKYGGMTLRDYFAAHAPISNLFAPEWTMSQENLDKYGEFAYRWADAMLKAKNK